MISQSLQVHCLLLLVRPLKYQPKVNRKKYFIELESEPPHMVTGSVNMITKWIHTGFSRKTRKKWTKPIEFLKCLELTSLKIINIHILYDSSLTLISAICHKLLKFVLSYGPCLVGLLCVNQCQVGPDIQGATPGMFDPHSRVMTRGN